MNKVPKLTPAQINAIKRSPAGMLPGFLKPAAAPRVNVGAMGGAIAKALAKRKK